MARPIQTLPLTASQRQLLQKIAGEKGDIGIRARIILGLAAGKGQQAVADANGVTIQTVSKWSRRFAAGGVEALADTPRSGRPRVREDVVKRVCSGRLGEIVWVAKEAGVSRSTASRWRKEHPEWVPEPEKRYVRPPREGDLEDHFRYYIHARHTVYHVRRKPKPPEKAR